MLGKLQQQQSSRIRLERQFLYLEKNLLLVMYIYIIWYIVPIFAEKIDFSKGPRISRGSSIVIFILHL